MEQQPAPLASLPERTRWMETVSHWLDTRFRIPFTQIRFGLDFLVGLIPYLGDVVSFSVSALLILAMIRFGVSGRVLVLMVWNVALDLLVGTIPILGDLFDLKYKANRRNFELLRAHYHEGRHKGSAWPLVLLFLLLLLVVFGAILVLLAIFWQWFWEGVKGMW